MGFEIPSPGAPLLGLAKSIYSVLQYFNLDFLGNEG